jgi:hypothetical protein
MAFRTQLVPFFFFSSRFHQSLSPPFSLSDRQYDFNSVVSIAAVVYSFLGCVPLAIWFLFRQLETNTSLVAILCVYGYSLTVFIPASVIPLSLFTSSDQFS